MWDFLALALLLLRFSKKCGYIVLAVAIMMGCSVGVLDWTALVWIVATGVILLIRTYVKPYRSWRHLTEAVLVADAVALMLHLVHGFKNLRVLDGVYVSPDSLPFTMYYNFDKALVPFILLGCVSTLFYTKHHKHVSWQWGLLVAAVPGLLMLATLAGGLRVEFHAPVWLLDFTLANIFFVSLAEEALFRGYLQQRLARAVNPAAALVISALSFGVMHYHGGLMMVLFASLAGLIYGIAWMWSGRLWVAVLFHFGLNLTQLLFFTYPALRHLP
ncbi:hypothetical protein SAMN05216516_10822 [Izhakiella capsodis]|uniref:CAAX prenyl protease 2/Lysostaphin resistance protein A-like domain-containing protein n=1 Tax=Izhakiella capsodis TaxID=1367852 RepID=A0A1I4Z7L8_9GAMM|nr:CPBP family intramembrane glutamic endopeptidase [Izhakiella capsodis]SFN46291.1 hypothetical protein SAMN05216516_10822 [Izhakiella capsodis]